MDPQNMENTLYNAYLFKSPGMRRWIRFKAHNWGVDKLNKIIEKDIKEDVKNKLMITKEKARKIKLAAQERAAISKEKLKQRLITFDKSNYNVNSTTTNDKNENNM